MNEVWQTLLVVNSAVIAVLFILEKEWGFHYELSQRLTYARIELIKPQHYVLLLGDLRTRTRLAVKRYAVERINFLRDTAEIKFYYDDPHQSGGVFAWMDTELLKLVENDRYAYPTILPEPRRDLVQARIYLVYLVRLPLLVTPVGFPSYFFG